MGQMAFKGITKIGAQSSGVRGTNVVSFHSDKNVLVFGLQVLQSNKWYRVGPNLNPKFYYELKSILYCKT